MYTKASILKEKDTKQDLISPEVNGRQACLTFFYHISNYFEYSNYFEGAMSSCYCSSNFKIGLLFHNTI